MNSREEESKDLIRRYVETWNQGDIEGLTRFWARDMIHHTRGKKQGFDEVKQIVTSSPLRFPTSSSTSTTSSPRVTAWRRG